MVGAGAVGLQGRKVGRGAVPGIIRPPVFWEFGVKVGHDLIARDLGDDAGGSDGQAG